MGKKVKKKSRGPLKEKRVAAHSPKKVPQQSDPSPETAGDEVSAVTERKPCFHLEKGVDLSKLSARIGSSEPIMCEECRVDGKGSKGKGKHGKKKSGAAVDSISDSRPIWVCLECGHYACGGVGLPTGPQSHTVRHVRQTHHPLVIHFEKPQLCWCFPCKTLIPIVKMEENGDHKNVLSDVVKLIKGRSSVGSSVDVEDVWLGVGSVTSEIKAGSSALIDLDLGGNYVIRGLVNLGNTCFFNSVMQNLLAMRMLRDYFSQLDTSSGPLTIALKKLFIETKQEGGLKNVINPRSFFGCLCSKAPQFRGYQQHDSHELLCCLLDGLSTEELGSKKQHNSPQGDGISSNLSTFVDAVFGGQISSTVCCVECGYSSTVYEPFLDLSLPVPTKKPPSKKAQPVTRAKKTKLPPKKGGKTRPKVNKDADLLPAQSVSNLAASNDISCQEQAVEAVAEKEMAFSCNSMPSSSSDLIVVAGESGSASQNLLAVQASENEQVFENVVEQTSALLEDFTWLDYIDPETVSDEWHLTQSNGVSTTQDPENKDIYLNDAPLQVSSDSSSQTFSANVEPNLKPDSSVNYWEDELPLQVQDTDVLLLPYKVGSPTTGEIIKGGDEASSSVAGYGPDEMDFDGFGDMFNEPEISMGPAPRPSFDNVVAETVVVGNNSDSDPDEVDNTDSPVTVESCLAHFIKPELLSNENAWHCENCSKTLRHERLRAKRQVKNASMILLNGDQIGSQNEQLPCPAEVGNLANGYMKNEASLEDAGEILILDKAKMDCAQIENGQTGELNSVVSQWEEGTGVIKGALPEKLLSSGCYKTCCQESFCGQAIESCNVHARNSVEYTTGKVHHDESLSLAQTCESAGSEDEDMNSKSVKVKRDATKRVLIYRAPPILTIHLKRFSQDARGRLSKLNGHVSFRETIDLRPYLDPRCIDKEKHHYRLIGVVEHSGTMRGGHYVAFVRGGQKSSRGNDQKENDGSVWYHASDAYVRQASLDEVLGCDAYILFYEKI
ncbi:ubiquitin carboxyl-terminal hydrolase 2-like [Juglans microcarpa x Juglans regia]|uniref:ubiquitin carboxyl-terminal hydrolase 2-like n=1 Tax=Juglans microcarpa x Juglans regia TaxID=2249226 RepID=UPI001B7F2496|nr:ubiquitin carboxyl-terminal hydrolase 2-like [Juglans microcarpa x Juglans regia]